MASNNSGNDINLLFVYANIKGADHLVKNL